MKGTAGAITARPSQFLDEIISILEHGKQMF